MKRKILIIGIACLIVTACFLGLFPGSAENIPETRGRGIFWFNETVDFIGLVGSYTSIAIDSLDNPHISYYDLGSGDLKYAYWTGSSWKITTVDFTDLVGLHTSIALDSSDNPHISYYDNTNNDLKYAYWNGSSWNITTLDSAGNVGKFTSIALDTSDNPHISYYDDTNDDLKYTYWTGSSWAIKNVNSMGSVGSYTSIAIDTSDNPHISYFDWTNYDLKYAYWTGSSWNITPVDPAGGVGSYTSITLDSSDKPHISYCDVTNIDLKYAYWTGSSWNITTVDSDGNVGGFTSIELDSSDNPHISYSDNINYDLKYAYWTGSSWNITLVDSAGNVGLYLSLALDSSDNPHFSYHDQGSGDLKYAKGILDNDPPEQFKPTAEPSGWTTNTEPVISFFTIDNISGMDYYEVKVDDGNFSEQVSPYTLPAQPDGVHNITVRALDKAKNYRDEYVNVYIDTFEPDSFTPHADPGWWANNTQPKISFNTTDATSGIDYYEVKVDQGEFSKQESPYTLPTQIDGIHNITVRAVDKAGNYRNGTVDAYVDITKPMSFEILAKPTGWTSNTQPKITFSTSDATSGIDYYEVKIDLGNFYEQPSPYTLPSQTDGIHNVIARAYDKAGNYQDATGEVYIDTIAPSIIHTPITTAIETEAITLTATVTDIHSGVNEFTLCFKKPTDNEYLTLSMQNSKDDIYSAKIPAGGVTSEGLEYYIKAEDKSSPTNIMYYGEEGETDREPTSQTDIDITITKKDTTRPMIIDKSPMGTNVSIETAITVTFSEPMSKNATEGAFSISPIIQGKFSWDENMLIFTPDSPLDFYTEYTVTIGTGSKDLAENSLASEEKWSFTTEIAVTDSDEDGMPDWWEDKYGLNKEDPTDANLDLDEDGYTNLQEFLGNSDPTDPTSIPSLGAPPVAKLSVSKTLVYIGDEVILDASNSSDLDNDELEYFFDFGDNTNSSWTSNAIVQHIYSSSGIYTIKLIVRDDKGLLSDEITKDITVENKAPKVARPAKSDGGNLVWGLAAIIVILVVIILIILWMFVFRKRKQELEESSPPIPAQYQLPEPRQYTSRPPIVQKPPTTQKPPIQLPAPILVKPISPPPTQPTPSVSVKPVIVKPTDK